MTIKKVTHFVFPVGEPFKNTEWYYNVLAEADSGFFPISDKGLPHLGIHIDDNVLKRLGANEGRLGCMAHGEVVAYRVNEVYPKITYTYSLSDTIKKQYGYFSSGFTLVRHHVVLPVSADGTSMSPPSLTLYSLYMHQLDWFGYTHKEKLDYPHYWEASEGKVTTTKKLIGTIVRHQGAGTHGVALLMKGSQIGLGESIGRGWYRLVSLISGCIVTESGPQYEQGSLTGFVHRSDLEATLTKKIEEGKPYTVIGINNAKFGLNQRIQTGAALFAEPNAECSVGCVFTQTFLRLGKTQGGYVQVLSAACPLPAKSAVWVNQNDLTLNLKPHALDKVVVLNTPYPIEAGELIGYVGHYLNVQQSMAQQEPVFSSAPSPRDDDKVLKRRCHIEVFTCDHLPDFIRQTQHEISEESGPWSWKNTRQIADTSSPAKIYQMVKEHPEKHDQPLPPLLDAIHTILKQTSMYKAGHDQLHPAFTPTWFKGALRDKDTAVQFGELVIHYESEWYADEQLSKWNAIDGVLQNAMQQARTQFECELRNKRILDPRINQSLSVFDDIVRTHDNEWQTEKKDRISPLLWWKEVAEKQDTLPKTTMTNLTKDGMAWFLHPIKLLQFLVQTPCFCHRDFTMEEVRLLVHELRVYDRVMNDDLFNHRNCTLNKAQRNYESFTRELNNAMKKYEINTCLRKAHFLAQIYHETAHLTITSEEKSGKEYNPGRHRDAIKMGNTEEGDGPKYKGRGLMQLTWKNNYKEYQKFIGIDLIDDYFKISDELVYAIDSAAWYWRYGSIWKDLNKKADMDDIYSINIGVNGGLNGFAIRIKYIKLLIDMMKIRTCTTAKLEKKLGIYSFATSSLKSSKYGEKNQSKLESYNDE